MGAVDRCSRLSTLKFNCRFLALLIMVYAPWVNEFFDNIAGSVDLDDVGGFFRISSNTWELLGVHEEPEIDDDPVLSQIIYYDAPDEDDILEDSELWLIEQEHLEFQFWVRGIEAYADLLDPSDDWEVWWNHNFAPSREPWLYVVIDGYVGRNTPWSSESGWGESNDQHPGLSRSADITSD